MYHGRHTIAGWLPDGRQPMESEPERNGLGCCWPEFRLSRTSCAPYSGALEFTLSSLCPICDVIAFEWFPFPRLLGVPESCPSSVASGLHLKGACVPTPRARSIQATFSSIRQCIHTSRGRRTERSTCLVCSCAGGAFDSRKSSEPFRSAAPARGLLPGSE